jgi:hypothetical protein
MTVPHRDDLIPVPTDPTTVRKLIALAKSYPGERPAFSYVFVEGTPQELAEVHAPLIGDERRTALLAYGANASPERLAWKLSHLDGPQEVPVLRCRLRDFDAGYSAHVSINGAISGTLMASPGTVMHAHALLVTGEQLEVISAIEFNYDLLRLEGVELELDGGSRRETVLAYASKHGALTVDGEPVAMAAIEATGRRLRALDEVEVQEAARASLDPGCDLDGFIALSIHRADERERRTAELRARAAPLGLDRYF